MEDSRYLYATGRVRALETGLLDSRLLGRIAESGSGEDFLGALKGTVYSSDSMEEFEAGLDRKSAGLAVLARKLLREAPLLAINGLKHDFFNCSAFLRAKHSSSGAEPALDETGGAADVRLLESAVLRGKTRGLDEHIAGAVRAAEERFEKTGSVLEMELELDRRYFSALREKCAETRNGFFMDFARLSADVYNINAFFRVKKHDPGIELSGVLSDAGSIEPDELERFIDDEEGMSRFFARTSFSKMAGEGLSALKDGGELARPETSGRELLLDFLSGSRYVTMGPEPVFAYFARAGEEIKSLKVIRAGRKAGLPAAAIMERVAMPS